MTRFLNEKALQFSEVYIVPQYSEVNTRGAVSTKTVINHMQGMPPDEGNLLEIEIPVMSANMDTVTDGQMAIAMWKGGAIGSIHRFMTIEQNVAEFLKTKEQEAQCFVSIGVNEESKDRALALYQAGARYFVIDIAHGHSKLMRTMVEWMRLMLPRSYIMAGNVATPRAVRDLAEWGADAVKIGIGPGAVCTTKNITGVTVPQFTAIKECCAVRTTTHSGLPLVRVADGGIQEIGDIAKALGAGADVVMCGRLFAGCKEAPGPRVNGTKVYRGMASKDAMLTIRDEKDLPTPEGVSTLISDSDETAAQVLTRIQGGLRSSFSYSNARHLVEFKQNVVFGIRS